MNGVKKLDVKICVGTYCYVMGGSKLNNLKSQLPDDLKDEVYVEASVCLGCDRITTDPKPPYAEVNGKLIEKANLEKIIAAIRVAQEEIVEKINRNL
jgi:NADH:ubiquinone oxidoreductase subunit E